MGVDKDKELRRQFSYLSQAAGQSTQTDNDFDSFGRTVALARMQKPSAAGGAFI